MPHLLHTSLLLVLLVAFALAQGGGGSAGGDGSFSAGGDGSYSVTGTNDYDGDGSADADFFGSVLGIMFAIFVGVAGVTIIIIVILIIASLVSYICGNGGSGARTQHLQARYFDLAKDIPVSDPFYASSVEHLNGTYFGVYSQGSEETVQQWTLHIENDPVWIRDAHPSHQNPSSMRLASVHKATCKGSDAAFGAFELRHCHVAISASTARIVGAKSYGAGAVRAGHTGVWKELRYDGSISVPGTFVGTWTFPSALTAGASSPTPMGHWSMTRRNTQRAAPSSQHYGATAPTHAKHQKDTAPTDSSYQHQ